MQGTRSSLDIQKGPADWVIGDVYIDAVAAPAGTSTFAAAAVHLNPGARTAWHTHPHGQTIFVTEGVGLGQREGSQVDRWGTHGRDTSPAQPRWCSRADIPGALGVGVLVSTIVAALRLFDWRVAMGMVTAPAALLGLVLADERQRQRLDYIGGSVNCTSLADEQRIVIETVRRVLRRLVDRGVLQGEHGGTQPAGGALTAGRADYSTSEPNVRLGRR